MELSRRAFLKTVGGLAGVALLSNLFIKKGIDAAGNLPGKTILIDVGKCIACGDCHTACGAKNNLQGAVFNLNNPFPLSGQDWVAYVRVRQGRAWRFRKHSCMHCIDAGCLEACPTGAIHREGEAVVIDQEWCTGCGYCVQACPFMIPHKDKKTGTARKCDFCIDLVAQGGTPACVAVCPTEALLFGNRDDMIARANTRQQELLDSEYPQANVYGINELAGLHVIHVFDDKPSVYGLPDKPQTAAATSPFKWLSGFTALGIALTPIWLILKRRQHDNPDRKEVES